jgi:hypothetical protein
MPSSFVLLGVFPAVFPGVFLGVFPGRCFVWSSRAARTGYRADVIRALPLVLLLILALAVGSWVIGWTRGAVARRPSRRGSSRTGGYEFDPRIDRARRRLRGTTAPAERLDEIEEFLNSHRGVEAYVEPGTVISPRSVVLVDGAGEWRRFELREDSHLRRLSSQRGLPIFDASRTGYPPRMRRRPGSEP